MDIGLAPERKFFFAPSPEALADALITAGAMAPDRRGTLIETARATEAAVRARGIDTTGYSYGAGTDPDDPDSLELACFYDAREDEAHA